MSLSYDYYPAVLRAIDLMSQGRTKTYACDEVNISVATLDQYVKNVPEIAELLEEAQTRGYDAMADMLLTIDHTGIYAQSNPAMAKIISDNIKWLLAKRRTKTYGDKLEVTHNITADKAITEALIAGRNRAGITYQDNSGLIDITPVLVNEDEAIMAELLS